jgi:hypothetical protein
VQSEMKLSECGALVGNGASLRRDRQDLRDVVGGNPCRRYRAHNCERLSRKAGVSALARSREAAQVRGIERVELMQPPSGANFRYELTLCETPFRLAAR